MFLIPPKKSPDFHTFSPDIKKRRKVNLGVGHRRAISHDVSHQGFFMHSHKKSTLILQNGIDVDSV